jgi:hypothetical protein
VKRDLGDLDSLASCCDREQEGLKESSQEDRACSESRKRERSAESLHVFEQIEAVGRRSSVVSGLLDQDDNMYLSTLQPIKACVLDEEKNDLDSKAPDFVKVKGLRATE